MGTPTSRRVTIKDVAALAEVSISTVSHTFSRGRPVAADTAARVVRAADKLGYRPHPVARSLRTGQSGLLGVILRPRNAVHGSLAGTETFTRFSGAAAAATLALGRGLVHVPDPLIAQSSQIAMDGCIVEGPNRDDKVLAELRRRAVPVVCCDATPEQSDDPWSILVDHATAATVLFDRLAATGASSIWLVSGEDDNAWNHHMCRAFDEFATGYPGAHRTDRLFEGTGVEGAYELARSVLDSSRRPDAVVVASTRFAVGVAQAAHELGISMPDRLQLAALTESDLTRLHYPGITSTDLRMEEQAQLAVSALVDRIQGAPPPEEPHVVRPQIRWRATTR